jgi:hypothetical protein
MEDEGINLKDIPERYVTLEMCFEAVRHNPLSLEFIPESLVNEDLCREAMKKGGTLLCFCMPEGKIREMCFGIVNHS